MEQRFRISRIVMEIELTDDEKVTYMKMLQDSYDTEFLDSCNIGREMSILKIQHVLRNEKISFESLNEDDCEEVEF